MTVVTLCQRAVSEKAEFWVLQLELEGRIDDIIMSSKDEIISSEVNKKPKTIQIINWYPSISKIPDGHPLKNVH